MTNSDPCLDLYELTKPYTESDVIKRFRELSQKHHPDKFASVSEAEFDRAHGLIGQIIFCKQALLISAGISPGFPTGIGAALSSLRKYITSLSQDPYLHIVMNDFERGHDPDYGTLNTPLDPVIKQRFKFDLYSHQTEAINFIKGGKNVIIVTPTASGKSLVYTIPFLEAVHKDPDATALFMFPTKALANDQLYTLESVGEGLMTVATYDGDVLSPQKKSIRSNLPNAIFTNPDEIHHGILNSATDWQDFFKNLKYIVLDDIHIYKGFFGSNVSNIIWRLLKAVKKAGGSPQIIATTATIDKALDFTEQLGWSDFELVNKSGAGLASRLYIMLESTVNEDQVLAKHPMEIAVDEAIRLSSAGFQTIVFCQSRRLVDIMTQFTKDRVLSKWHPQKAKKGTLGLGQLKPDQIIAGYHAGYSNVKRREVEQKIKNGSIKIIFTTNALELGIDIGTLDVCMLYGLPQTSNEIWQRIGRTGRSKDKEALVMVINTYSAFDRYYFSNPTEFLKSRQKPNRPIINPMNPVIRQLHLTCGYHERLTARNVPDKDNWKVIDKTISKRSAYYRLPVRNSWPNKYKLLDQNRIKIGTMDFERVKRELHYGAMVQIEEVYYKFKSLDWDLEEVILEKIEDPKYYTTPSIRVSTELDRTSMVEDVLDYSLTSLTIGYGQADVSMKVYGYTRHSLTDPDDRKTAQIPKPQNWPALDTKAFWLSIPSAAEHVIDEENNNPYLLYSVLHTLEHMLMKVFVERGHCDWSDISGLSYIEHPVIMTPTLVIYENFRKGLGLVEVFFDEFEELLKEVKSHLEKCPCDNGCPACIMTPGYCHESHDYFNKEATLTLLDKLLANTPKRVPFQRVASGVSNIPMADSNTEYKAGEEYCPGWFVVEQNDSGLIIKDKSGTLHPVIYEDTPL